MLTKKIAIITIVFMRFSFSNVFSEGGNLKILMIELTLYLNRFRHPTNLHHASQQKKRALSSPLPSHGHVKHHFTYD